MLLQDILAVNGGQCLSCKKLYITLALLHCVAGKQGI